VRIETYEVLPSGVLPRIEELWLTCQKADGTNMPLNTDTKLNNHPGLPSLYLAYGERALVGYLQLFHPRQEEVEITGVTHPAHRHRGVFSALLEAAGAELDRRPSIERRLVVVDGHSETGAAFARNRGALLWDTEYLMELTAPLPPLEPPSGFEISPVALEDVEPVAQISARVFCESMEDALLAIRRTVESEGRLKFKATVEGRLVGFGGLSWEGDRASIFGIGIAPDERRRGYGTALVHAIAKEALRTLPDGTALTLEVSRSNEGALELYRRLGFEQRGSYDYYELPAITSF
jgi:ribosomal protein S18 acetylase RimI-like enzyme